MYCGDAKQNLKLMIHTLWGAHAYIPAFMGHLLQEADSGITPRRTHEPWETDPCIPACIVPILWETYSCIPAFGLHIPWENHACDPALVAYVFLETQPLTQYSQCMCSARFLHITQHSQ